MTEIEDRLRRVENAILLLPGQLKGIQDSISTQNGNVAKLTQYRYEHDRTHDKQKADLDIAKALKDGQTLTLSRGWKIVIGAIGVIGLVMPIAGFGLVLTQENEVDFDCLDFRNESAAQREYDSWPNDRYGLDPDGDGIACEELP